MSSIHRRLLGQERIRKTMASICRRPHVVVVPFPTQGHINPMMDLATKLADCGFFVTFVNTDHNHLRIRQAVTKAKSHPIQEKEMANVRLVSIPDGLASQESRSETPKLLRAMERTMGPSLKDLIRLINEKEEQRVTALIIDVTLCFILDALSLSDDIAIAALWPALIAAYGICYNTSTLVSSGILPSNGIPKEQKIVKYLPFLPPINSDYLPWLFGEEADREYLFQVGLRNMERIKRIKWVLFNSFYDLEAPIIDAFPIEAGLCPIGPLIPSRFLHRINSDLNKTELMRPSSFWAEELECLDWLDKQSPETVIYVAFGSQAMMKERQMEELALGLEATQRPFLWVLRRDLSVVLPSGYIERIGERGCILSWAPQLSVLSHPSIACFITHCGWNSTMESISMGVPMICWPFSGDQFINRVYIVEVWKVGLSFTSNQDDMVEARDIVKAVERLSSIDEGMEIRRRAVRLKEEARGAVNEGGSSFINFHGLCNAFSSRPGGGENSSGDPFNINEIDYRRFTMHMATIV